MELRAKVLVVGGGAIGGLFAWRLSVNRNLSVSVVCRSNYDEISRDGYHISSALYGEAVYRPEAVFMSVDQAQTSGPFDYVVVALKALPNIYDCPSLISPVIGPTTMIILMQNGIGIEQPFATRFPETALASTACFVSVKQTSPGHLKHGGFAMLAAGMHDNSRTRPNIRKLQHLLRILENNKVNCLYEVDVQPFRWQKHILNGSTNPVSVVCGGSSCQEMVQNDHCCKLLQELMAEIFVLGKTVTGKAFPGVDGIVDPQSATDFIKSIPVPVYTSMLVDSQCKRPMELEVILKNPILLAEKHNVDVPNMKAMYALLSMIEAGYSKQQ